MRLVFLGPPGVGKGTQALKIKEKLKLPQISTGDMLRTAVTNQTRLGKQAKTFMDAGQLVPDDLIIQLIQERLQAGDAQDGFVLDGFPRTVEQAKALDHLLTDHKVRLDHVIALNADQDTVVKRISGRRSCKKCSGTQHVIFEPPKTPGKCDRCGGELFQRADDQEDTVRKRLEVYFSHTQPLIDFYRKKGLLREVDAEGNSDEVFHNILRILGKKA